MDLKTLQYILDVFGAFAGLVMLAIISGLIRRTVVAFSEIRAFSAIPFAMYGGVSMQNAFHNHYGNQGQLLPKSSAVWISQTLHGVVGLALVGWMIICTFAGHRIKLQRVPYSSAWADRRFSTGYFYIAILDLIFLLALIVTVAMGSTYTPWSSSNCAGYQIRPSADTPSAATTILECRKSLTSQIMGLISFFMLCLHITLIIPMISPPTILRPAMVSLIRTLRSPKVLPAKPNASWSDVEMAMLIENEKTPSLNSMLRDDAIAARLAQYLHFNDVANIALASKQIRAAIFTSSTKNRSDRFEMLCETACADGRKTECWACAKVICDECKFLNYQMPLPRTLDHLQSCYAVCNKCYILRPSSTQRAPLSSIWNSKDLATQHPKCYLSKPSVVLNHPVDLCFSCAMLPQNAIVEIREKRETKMLKVALERRIKCARCETVLSKEKKRWWICELGNHDCHWEGHEVKG